MLSTALILVIVLIALGIIGFVVNGLFWLFIVAVVLFVSMVLASFFIAGARSARQQHKSEERMRSSEEEDANSQRL